MDSDRNVLMPRESGKFIAQSAKDVFIEEKGIENIALMVIKNLQNKQLSITNFTQHPSHPSIGDPRAIDWLLVIDTLNFCFWTDDDQDLKRWTVNGQSGYFALCTAIKRALAEGIPITDANHMSKITRDQVKKILKGDKDDVEIPLIDERVKNLNEVGRVLVEKYNGTFLECIKSCKNSAEQLLKLIVKEFKCFRDEANYQNQNVSFYKRAQILVGDIWAFFQGKDVGSFNDIEYITMFPDYRVPQVLVHFGAMRYSTELTDKLNSNINLQSGCIEEIEIRGCSIEVVERIVEKVKSLIKNDPSLELKESDCNSVLVDHFLWDYRRKHADELNNIRYHKVIYSFARRSVYRGTCVLVLFESDFNKTLHRHAFTENMNKAYNIFILES